MSWNEVRELPRATTVAVLPIGATEAHGPHLALGTDVAIADAFAREGGRRLELRGVTALLLPPLTYTVARYAAGFAGTISIQPQTATALIVDIARSLASHGLRYVVLANAHLEPDHIASLRRAVELIEREALLACAFPDVTRKPWALRLGDEFRSGACHAGRYEGSIVMASRPDLVRDHVRRGLPPCDISLSRAIRDGKKTFEEAGGVDAYFGDPAAATEEEGRTTIAVLGAILEEATLELLVSGR